MAGYERLTALDRTFLDLEEAGYHQHVGAVLIFESGALRTPDAGIDAAAIRQHVASRLHRIPRYRQRLEWIPLENHPVWVDDDRFRLEYHVRHTALPRPGTEEQLKALAARIHSQRLDREKPLWELWIVEGLDAGKRFALISKSHHCMIDGISGVDLMTVLLSPRPDETPEPVHPWVPERVPSRVELARRELERRATLPLQAVARLARAARHPRATAAEAIERLEAVAETLSAGLRPASETPLNRPLGPHRRVDWTAFDLARVKRVKDRLGGTVNDVVLATVAGALGRFFEQRGIAPAKLRRMDIRAMVPVSLRTDDERGTLGNRIALWPASLPVGESDPRRRLAAVREVTTRLKHGRHALGASVLASVSEWTVPTLLSVAARMAYRAHAANLVVTNVPGPQVPLYLLGARMRETYPLLNLLIDQTLGVALFSYDKRLFWGLVADWDHVPDLEDFTAAIEASFAELLEAADQKGRERRSARPGAREGTRPHTGREPAGRAGNGRARPSAPPPPEG